MIVKTGVQMKLSKNFTKEEFEHSETANKNKIINRMSVQETKNAIILCNKLLEPIREHFNKPLIISSGFRSKALNKLTGGSPTSQHLFGQAVDFNIHGIATREAFQEIIKLNFTFDQIINEFNSWIHISYAENPRKQIFEALKIGGKTIYKEVK